MAAGLSGALVGRDDDLARLVPLVDAVAHGAGTTVLVGGPAGIGKTRLSEALGTRAGDAGLTVAWTACWESAALPPFAPWAQLLEQLGEDRSIVEAPAADAALEADAVRAGRFAEVAAALRRASARRALLLVVDDLHWADPATLRLLAVLAPQLRSMPVGIVATYRPDEIVTGTVFSVAFADLARHARRHDLRPLDAPAVGALVASATGRPAAAATAERLHAWTGGNPLFVLELARELDAAGRLETAGGTSGDRADVVVPPTVAAVFHARLARCSAPCREVLDVAAVAGDVSPFGLLADVTGTAGEALLSVLDEAEGLGLVREVAPGRYGFTHPILRATILQGLRVATRVRLHARVGGALEAALAAGARVDLAALAYHYTRAAPGGTAAAAVRFATAAGREAMATAAFEAAAGHLERALDLLAIAPGAADRADLLLALGEARLASGEREAARAVLGEAAAEARRTGRPGVLARAALGLAAGGGFEVELFDAGQVALLEEAVDALGDADPGLLSRCLARLSVASSLAADVATRAAMSDRAVALARRASDEAALTLALAAGCDAHAGPADTDLRLAESAEIVRIATRRGDRRSELLGRRLRLVALLEAGDVAAARREIDAYAATARALREPVFSWYVPLWASALAFAAGRVGEAFRLADEARAAGEAAGSVNVEILSKSQAWLFALELADRATVAATFEELLGWGAFEVLGPQMAGSFALGWAWVGNRAEAVAALDTAARVFPTAPVDSEWVPLLVQAADAVALVGGHPIARWLYDTLAPFEHRHGVEGIAVFLHGPIARHLGVLASVLGEAAAAERHFAVALATNERAGAALLAARTRRDRGVALGRRDDLVAAREAYRQLGVPGRVAELEARLGSGAVADVPTPTAGAGAAFVRTGDTWALRWDGVTAHARDAKGMRDVAVLLARPGREVAAADLYGASLAGGDLGEVVDEQARRAYRARLVQLERELDEADARGDADASARAAAERDALLAQLAGALGLGGRARRAGSAGERARTAVTARVRDAIRRVEAVHPALGRHLRRAVRTGTYCSYEPDPPVDWEL